MSNRKTTNDEDRERARPNSLEERGREGVGSPWPHRLAWIVAGGVIPLIFWGGMVTTYKAGMAVPDWPTTKGSWFYPLQKWIWDTGSELFLEHGHRTVGQLVGLAAIFLLVAVFRSESRKPVRWLAIIILGGLLFQGLLGGYRVLWNELLLARIHGCTAPLVFCACTLMAAVTSPVWRDCTAIAKHRAAGRMRWLSAIITVLIYLEIVFGTLLRHPIGSDWTIWLLVWAWSKVITAGLLCLAICWLLVLAGRSFRDVPPLRNRAALLAALVLVQVILAGTAWVANYGWPKWFADNVVNWNYTVTKEGVLQVWITTAHAAVASLVLAAAFNLTAWSRRLLRESNA